MAGTQKQSIDLIQKIPAGVISFTDDGNMVFINDWLLNLLDYQFDQLNGVKIEQIFTLSSRIFYQTHLFPLIKLHGKIEEVFLSLKGSQAHEIPVLIYAQREQTEASWINNLIIVPVRQRQKYEDEILKAKQRAEKIAEENTVLIDAQKELELKTNILDKQIVQLSQANKQFTALSKVVSHDLQEPIRKISLFTKLIKESGGQHGDRVSGYYEKTENAINRLILLTRCLSQFVSITNSTEQAQILPFKELIQESISQARAELVFEDLEVEIGNFPVVEGYTTQIKQLFYELIKNSIQYRDKSRPLRISVSGFVTQYNDYKADENRYKYVDFARIEYTDNGTGFSNEYKEYVFEIFKRIHFDIEGLGFGLTLCKKIANNHLGEMYCQSTLGVGTTFTIILPMNLLQPKSIDARS